MLLFFSLDVDRHAFQFPFLNHFITWYGILFASGCLIAYYLLRTLLKEHLKWVLKPEDNPQKEALVVADRMTLFIVLGTILGARLGHVFFYDWSFYKFHLTHIWKVWEGGLASHGGVVGIVLAIFLFCKTSKKEFPYLTFFTVLDALILPAIVAAIFIRVGNFINQEILGTPTSFPWGVIFLHPAQKTPPVPLHPVQLYEALGYLGIGVLLFLLWKVKEGRLGSGVLSLTGLFLLFTFRFFIEFLKLPQSDLIDERFLTMGQILSIPIILLSLGLLIYKFYVLSQQKR